VSRADRETEPAPPPLDVREYARAERDRLLAIARESRCPLRSGSALGWAYRMHDMMEEET
jgi:hypothetical protein